MMLLVGRKYLMEDPNKMGITKALAVMALIAVLSQPIRAQSTAEELKALRREIEALKASQTAMQKNIEIIKLVVTGKQPPLENVFVETMGAPALGAATAKVTLVEFSDYQCPFCGRYATQTMSQILDEYVKTGKVRYIFRNFPLESIHPLAAKAAEGVLCAGEQNKYWEMHDRLFKNQSALDAKELAGHALVLGLDTPKFQQCLDSGKSAAQVKSDIQEGTKLGVRGTPAFFLGLTDTKSSKIKAELMLSGAQPISAFKEAIDKLLNPPKEEGKGSSE
jgi:protein-disulfide isomerase